MPSLLLHAADPLWQPVDPEHLCGVLRKTGLIAGNSVTPAPDKYRVGKRFLQLITFLGCSPHIVLDPDAAAQGQAVCYVRLLNRAAVDFMAAMPAPAVRCAYCRAAAAPTVPGAFDDSYRCEQCGRVSKLTDLDWRQGAGFARCFIEITAIHPHEALPTEQLLNTLGALSGCRWKYFYA